MDSEFFGPIPTEFPYSTQTYEDNKFSKLLVKRVKSTCQTGLLPLAALIDRTLNLSTRHDSRSLLGSSLENWIQSLIPGLETPGS